MNKSKRELFEENKRLKAREKAINEYLYDENNITVDKIIEIDKNIKKLTKIIYIITLILLLLSAFLIGLSN